MTAPSKGRAPSRERDRGIPDRRLPIVGVIGSGTEPHLALARPVGALLARLGVHLLTGGGGGVMDAVSRAFAETPGRRGLVLGIIPAAGPAAGPGTGAGVGPAGAPGVAPVPGGRPESALVPPPGYPNPWVELPIRTHLPQRGSRGEDLLSRNHLIVLTAEALVALPGGAGTASEITLAARYGTPLRRMTDPSRLPEVETWLEGLVAPPL